MLPAPGIVKLLRREGREDVTFPDAPAQATPSQLVISWLKPPLRGTGTWPFPESRRGAAGRRGCPDGRQGGSVVGSPHTPQGLFPACLVRHHPCLVHHGAAASLFSPAGPSPRGHPGLPFLGHPRQATCLRQPGPSQVHSTGSRLPHLPHEHARVQFGVKYGPCFSRNNFLRA